MSSHPEVERVIAEVKKRYETEVEFVQAVEEILSTLGEAVSDIPEVPLYKILDALVEPDHIHTFRVNWTDDKGEVHVNRGYRVQFNGVLGPYKGGIRFHPSVNLSVLKFLGFEQTFKNALTGLSLGGGKGGSDFDPKGKSDAEVARFCTAFMSHIADYIGEDTDVPAGDLGVGAREIGYLFGAFRRGQHKFTGALTGKGSRWGGSLLRPQATGYGIVYFATLLMEKAGKDIKKQTAAVSGAGNVALFAVEKLVELGVKCLTVSDSGGTLVFKDGITKEQLEEIQELKNVKRGRLSSYSGAGSEFLSKKKPWGVAGVTLALPCATQNEVDEDDVKQLVDGKAIALVEGANMPCTAAAMKAAKKGGLIYAPGKACNAGGVAVSGFEMAQNSQRVQWTSEEVDKKLHETMTNIHETCVKYGSGGDDVVDYAKGANVGAFVQIAEAMIQTGVWC